MNQNEDEDELGQFQQLIKNKPQILSLLIKQYFIRFIYQFYQKSSKNIDILYYGVIISYFIHFSICIAIIIIASLSLKENQDSNQIVQWCTIELALITYHLFQQIYELKNQFYFIDLVCSSPQQSIIFEEKKDFIIVHYYTRYLSSNIFFFLNNHYIYGLLFSTNWFFRESYRIIPGTEKQSTCYDDYGPYDCYIYDIETIAPQYHGPYLTQLANMNVTLFAFSCLYLFYRISFFFSINEQNEKIQRCHFQINQQSIKKKSQIACMILIIYYICRATHSFIIYFQVQNETLLYSIGAYIFYSLMMISVLVSIIILIQLKFTKQKNYNYNFVSVFTLIDQIIYQNKPLNYYFWIMLIVSSALTCFGINKYRKDENVQDIVNYQNYVFADLIVAQLVLIFFLLIKYAPILIRSFKLLIYIQNNQSNINFSQVAQQNNVITIISQKDQINQNQKKQVNVIKQNKKNNVNNWDHQFKQFQKFLQKKSIFSKSFIQIKIQNKNLDQKNSNRKLKNLINIDYTIFNAKIIKFWKQKTKIQKDLKKRRINLIQSMRKSNKKQEDIITYEKQIQFIDQKYLGECTICLEQFEIINRTKNIIRLNCFGHHIFHADCIQNWFQNNKKKCPICNTNQIKISFN